MKSGSLLLVGLFMSACAHAGLIDGVHLQTRQLEEALHGVQPGSVVIIGENHGLAEHQAQQLEILEALRRQGLKVSVGMEFFTYTDQLLVDAYRSGSLAEQDFLKSISWGQPSFDFYRPQVQFPLATEASQTWALNAPRSLTRKVAQSGLGSLTAAEQALLPPQFSVGRDSYKKRFLSLMPHLPTPEAGDRYFTAQSIWDDTMAWRASEFMAKHPEQVLVIIVGEFHVQFGGGLPDRLRVRSPHLPLLTFSQVNTIDLSAEEIEDAIAPSAEEGPRADFIWLAPAVAPAKGPGK